MTERRGATALAALGLSIAKLANLTIGVARTRRLSGRVARPGWSPVPNAEAAAAAVAAASARHPARPSCLERSLVLWVMLRRIGLAASLRVGVRRTESGVAAHAWVELDGVPIGVDDPDDHTAFDEPFEP